MPQPTKTPFFAGMSDEPIADFLSDYGELADGHRLTDRQKVETVLRYIPYSLKDLWKSLPGYATGNWMTFKRELERLYPDMDAETRYSRQGLTELVNLSARTRMRDEKDVLDYYRRFLAISNPLRTTNLISDDERNAEFFRGFHPYDRTSMANRLYPLHPHRPCNRPYELQDVYSAARAYFTDMQSFRSMQSHDNPLNYGGPADPTQWPHRPPGDDHDTRRYDREPMPYQRDRDLPRDLTTQHSHGPLRDYTHIQPDPPGPEYETRSVCFTETAPKPTAREDKELEELLLKMHTLTVRDPVYMILYAQICHRFPNVAKTLPPPDFGHMTAVAYQTPTSHPPSTTTQQP